MGQSPCCGSSRAKEQRNAREEVYQAALHVGGGGARCGRRRAAQGGAAWRRAAQRSAERARRGRGAGKKELGACGGAGAERVEQRRRVGVWRRSEGAGGG